MAVGGWEGLNPFISFVVPFLLHLGVLCMLVFDTSLVLSSNQIILITSATFKKQTSQGKKRNPKHPKTSGELGDVPETETESLVAKFPSTLPILGDPKDLHRHRVPQSCGVKTDKSPQNGPHKNGICYKCNML